MPRARLSAVTNPAAGCQFRVNSALPVARNNRLVRNALRLSNMGVPRSTPCAARESEAVSKARSLRAVNGLEQRLREQRPIFGLRRDFSGRRWVARDGGPDDLALAHGEPRPHSLPLILVGMMRTRFDDGGWTDVHDTLGTMLMLAEQSRNNPAFQYATRDRSVIEHELSKVPGSDAWQPCELKVDEVVRSFSRLDRGDGWIAFCDLEDECLYVHAEQPDGSSLSVVTITEITPYQAVDVG
jgi:hypothetical protein